MDIVLAGLLPGPTELWVILAVIVLLFGASKIPEIARSIGRSKGEFKRGLEQGAKAAEAEDEDEEEEKKKRAAEEKAKKAA